MKTQPAEHEPRTLSLREVLACRGLESSVDRDRRQARERRAQRERMFVVQVEAPLPGIEVTYLALNTQQWEQLAVA